MALLLGRYKTIEDVTGLKAEVKDITGLRRAQKVLLIDDHPFPYKDLLISHSYQVDQFLDLENITMAAGYSMILCDMNGVGKKLGGDSGGFLIKELRKHYPLKPLLAYSGHDFNASFNKYFSLADSVIRKDISLEDWLETLDEITTKQTDPIMVWKKAREKLLSQGVRITTVLQLENEYSNRIESQEKMVGWKQQSNFQKFQPEVKAILESLIANLLTFYFVGK